MQNRFTAKGKSKEDKDLLLAYELKENQFKVELYIVPIGLLDASAQEFLETKWVEGQDFAFPEGSMHVTPDLNEDSILPEDVLTQETGKIRMKQNEWAIRLLTNKLWESYLIELEELKKKAETLMHYDRSLFDSAKSFWERVLEHRKERDISQERLEDIKNQVNGIFDKLKTFRKSESEVFDKESHEKKEGLIARLEALKAQATADSNFKTLFDELKKIQDSNKDARYSKPDFQSVRKAFDETFRFLNLKRDEFFSGKNQERIKGLNEALHKIERSLERDKKDIEYFTRKVDSGKINQLELQLIKVKMNLLKDTIASKEEKMTDIRKTLNKLMKQLDRNQTALVKDKTGEPAKSEPAADAETPAKEDAAPVESATEETPAAE